MCGIAGIIRFDREADAADLASVRGAVSTIEHRGPDFQDAKQFGKACLGHARLSIIDTSARGNQPMTDASGRFHITYNGELYNYKALRKELERAGAVFRTATDTEVVLQSFAHHGIDCLKTFNGFFSFAVYDRENQTLFAARDSMGIKPFYYQVKENALLIGSELSTIRAMGGPHNINHNALHLYFQLTYVPAPHTILAGVHKLKPGHFLWCEDGKTKTQSYIEGEKGTGTSAIPSGMTPAMRELKQKLSNAVNSRLVADVPVGTFLSGGIDSAIITSIAAKARPGIETFSLGFEDNKYIDESEIAQKAADHFGTHHHRLMVKHNDLTGAMNNLLQSLDEPFADSSAVAVYLLSQYTVGHVKVALSGDGGDELFAGYRKHHALVRSSTVDPTNQLLKAAYPLLKQLPGGRSSGWRDRLRKIQKYSEGLRYPLPERYWRWLEWTPGALVSALLLKPQPDYDMESSTVSQITPKDLNSILLADQRFLLPNDMLTKVDRMSMANGLEVRTPFLDHEFVAWVNRLPFNWKRVKGQGKHILREAFRNDLPSEILEAPKRGFEIPVEQWLRNELSSEIARYSSKQLIEEQAVFNYEALQKVIGAFLSGRGHQWAPTVWSFLVFQRWWFHPVKGIEPPKTN